MAVGISKIVTEHRVVEWNPLVTTCTMKRSSENFMKQDLADIEALETLEEME